jgi:hypothetical protein
MKLSSTLVVACFTAGAAVALHVPAPLHATAFASQRQPSTAPSPSDALFDPDRVIQIEIRLDAGDWHALRISHPILDDTGQVIDRGYDDAWAVWAPITQTEGEPPSVQTQRRGGEQNRGMLELTEVSTTLGGTISGTFTIYTTAFGEAGQP